MKKMLAIILCMVMAVSCVSFSADAIVKVNSPKIRFVTNTDTTTQKIKWSKVKSASGYELYCKKNSGKFKKIATLSKNKTKFTNKKLVAGKKYFYKVKAYKKVNGKKVYSKFSGQLGMKCTNYLVDLYEPYSKNDGTELFKNGSYFSIAGDNYSNGFILGNDYGSFYGDDYAYFNLKGKYKYLIMTIGITDDGEKRDSKFSIFSDDSLIDTFEVKSNALPKTIKVDIENANKLEFRKLEREGRDIGIANIKVYK